MIGDKQVIALSLGALLLAGATLYPVCHPTKGKGRSGALRHAPADQDPGLASGMDDLPFAWERGGGSASSTTASKPPRLIRGLEQAINTGDPAAAEGLFWKYLPILLSNGEAPAVENIAVGTPPGPMRDCLLRVFATVWAERDPTSALAWTTRLPTKRERDETYDYILSSLAGLEPARAVRLAAAQTNAEEAVVSAVYNWAERDPAAAQRWVHSFTSGSLRARTLNEAQGPTATQQTIEPPMAADDSPASRPPD